MTLVYSLNIALWILSLHLKLILKCYCIYDMHKISPEYKQKKITIIQGTEYCVYQTTNISTKAIKSKNI